MITRFFARWAARRQLWQEQRSNRWWEAYELEIERKRVENRPANFSVNRFRR